MTTKITTDTATRLYYQDGMFLTTSLMNIEQSYFVNQLALQNMYFYNAGYLNGLESSLQSNTVLVQSGAGLDANGDLLLLPSGNNVVTLPDISSFTDPMTIYLEYPQPVPSNDTVNMTATLTLASQDPRAGYTITVATVSVNQQNQFTLTDARVKVTSKISPPISSMPNSLMATKAPNANTAARGSYALTYQQLPPKGQSRNFTVYYDAAKQDAFTTTPQILLTMQTDVSPSTNLTSILSAAVLSPTTKDFTLQITANDTVPTSLTNLDVNWLAFVE